MQLSLLEDRNINYSGLGKLVKKIFSALVKLFTASKNKVKILGKLIKNEVKKENFDLTLESIGKTFASACGHFTNFAGSVCDMLTAVKKDDLDELTKQIKVVERIYNDIYTHLMSVVIFFVIFFSLFSSLTYFFSSFFTFF